MNRLRLSLVLTLSLLLSACGFHLRGTVELPEEWRSLYLSSSSPNSELTVALRNGFESNGVNITNLDEANYRLQLGEERFERRNLTIGRNARAAEFELVMSTRLRVTDSQGNEILPELDVSTERVMTHDPENVTGKVEESRILRDEMRQDLVQSLLRQIRFLATAPTPAADADDSAEPEPVETGA